MEIQYFQRKIAILILILIGALYGSYQLFNKKIDKPIYRFGFLVEHSVLTDDIDYYEFSSTNEYLEITEIQQINQKIAEKLVQEKVMLFSSLFERQRVGYKGQHTEYVDCPEAYKPIYHEVPVTGGLLRYFVGFANDRYVFGSCDRETSKNYAVNAFLFCSTSGRLLDIRYFISMASAKSVQPFVEKLSCEKID
ncbi:MAG: hypothetical protein BMS9Abin25_0265 [Gammaproteobacteria bacterium]|nr:MAG: hypothetical protein BMS9Abin25_0265 [Gammaproteobacteria bacterium]